jgi:hypothetical protein
MRNILYILLFINFSIIQAQKKPTIFKSNPFKKASLIFKNGDTINGVLKINSFNKIIFKKNEKDEKKIYDFKTVKGVIIHLDNFKEKYEYKRINTARYKGEQNKIFYHLLQPIIVGKISIYLDDYGAHEGTNLKKNIGYTTHLTNQRFYISKGNSNTMRILGNAKVNRKLLGSTFFSQKRISTINDLKINPNSRSFKKFAKKYYSDCSKLITKIESGSFSKKEFLLTVNFYNENCE